MSEGVSITEALYAGGSALEYKANYLDQDDADAVRARGFAAVLYDLYNRPSIGDDLAPLIEPGTKRVALTLTLQEYELLLAFVALGMLARDTILCPGDDRQVEGLQRATLTTVKLIEALRARLAGGEEPLIGRIDRTAFEAFGAELKLRLAKEEPTSPIIAPSAAEVVQLTNHRRRVQ